jgi:hypothetical protein
MTTETTKRTEPHARRLEAARIVETIERLGRRIAERFPDSGLSRLSQDLLFIASTAGERAEALRHPIWPLRALVAVLSAAIIIVAGWTLSLLRGESGLANMAVAVQAFEALVNDIVFVGIAIYFLVSVESRIKRRTALKAVFELRSVAHIVDMHQLTKDPDQFIMPRVDTASSPKRTLTKWELARYLDYCSEMLSLSSKVATLYAQDLNDPVVLDAVNDVEMLTSGLSRKIWQKIMILESGTPVRGDVPTPVERATV